MPREPKPGDGASPAALVVVDAQNGALASAHGRNAVVANIAALVRKARESGAPVLWVRHADEELVSGTEAWRIVPGLDPRVGETVIEKHWNSAFEDTPLDAELKARGLRRIVLAGAATNWCIRATAYGALERGYDLCLAGDAHTTESIPLDDGRRIEAESLILDLNIAMEWLKYPGRTNETKMSAEISFR